jgi:ABC-type lipoprotein release transport system permease subunit
VPVIVVAVAVLAAAIPARRASRVDPVAVLRME